MASLSRQSNGRFRLDFFTPDGKRRTIRPGKISDRNANRLKNGVELILERTEAGEPLDADTKAWLDGLSDALYLKLAKTGVVPPREQVAGETKTLGGFLEFYFAIRTDVKDRTITALRQAGNDLLAFFGEDKPIREITAGDAEEWRISLKPRLAETTIRKRCQKVKQFFRHAVKKGFIADNPFAELKSTNLKNKKRYFFLERRDADKVLEACPDASWRLLFALARFGGLRVPSEPALLKWEDVNWEHSRITVHSPKTEHHEGGESRLIPMFPELRPYLEDQLELTGDTAYVLPTRVRLHANPGTMLRKIIKRAGLTPWEKIWQNLRSTRQTELSEIFPAHVVCEWIGNSEDVAKDHYLQITDAHFAKAISKPPQNPPHEINRNGRNRSKPAKPTDKETPVFPGVSRNFDLLHYTSVAVEGLEPPTRGL